MGGGVTGMTKTAVQCSRITARTTKLTRIERPVALAEQLCGHRCPGHRFHTKPDLHPLAGHALHMAPHTRYTAQQKHFCRPDPAALLLRGLALHGLSWIVDRFVLLWVCLYGHGRVKTVTCSDGLPLPCSGPSAVVLRTRNS